jgi:hypothetical protein
MRLNASTFAGLCRARDLLYEVHDEPLTVEEVARAACISPAHFIRLFDAVFGRTPHQFRIDARLDHARRLHGRGLFEPRQLQRPFHAADRRQPLGVAPPHSRAGPVTGGIARGPLPRLPVADGAPPRFGVFAVFEKRLPSRPVRLPQCVSS